MMPFFDEAVDYPETARLALDDRDDTIFATIDFIDWLWARQWVWSWVWDKRKKKRYAKRNTHFMGRQITLYLHKEIARRAHGDPVDDRTIADHIDGDSLNCRRDNLKWANRSENNANRAFTRCSKGRFS